MSQYVQVYMQESPQDSLSSPWEIIYGKDTEVWHAQSGCEPMITDESLL